MLKEDNKMKRLEEEYENHSVPSKISDRILDSTYLEINIEDILRELAKTSRKIYLEYLKNRAVSRFKKLLSRILPDTKDLDEVLEEDCDYLLELLIHIGDNSELFAEIKDAITEENYQELIKLTDFAVDKYGENFNYLQGMRESLAASLKGISMTNNKNSDSREEVKEFIRKKINESTDNKHLEKKS